MSTLAKHFPFGYKLYMRIAEPRVVRLLYFGKYLCMLAAGIGILMITPERYQNVINLQLVYVFGGFMTLGSLIAAFAVLPGIWWLERAGLLALGTSMAMYAVIVTSIGPSIVGLAIAISFILSYIIRWMAIRRYQLAPKEPVEV